MEVKIKYHRLLLWTFSGEDDFIIRRCDRKVQRDFAIIGAWVIVLMCLCWFSTFLFFEHVFYKESAGLWHSVVSFLIASVWGLMVLNLYLLVLYTITPRILPGKSSANEKHVVVQKVKIEVGAAISLAGRLLFLALLAIIIAQPLIIFLYENLPAVLARPEGWENEHFVKNIRLISSQPPSWALSIILIMLFWFPISIKFLIRRDTNFYELKQQIEHEMIKSEYQLFKRFYREILTGKIEEYNNRTLSRLEPLLTQVKNISPNYSLEGLVLPDKEISFYESHIDAPFNTQKKSTKIEAGSEKELLEFLNTNEKS